MVASHSIVTWRPLADERPRPSSTVLGFDGEASAEYYVNEAGQWFAPDVGQIDEAIIVAWAYMPTPPKPAEQTLFAEKALKYEDGADGKLDILWA